MFLSIVRRTSNFLSRYRQKLSVLFPAESCFPHRLAIMHRIDEQELHPVRKALINQQPHFKVAVRLVLASSSAAMASSSVTREDAIAALEEARSSLTSTLEWLY